MAAKAATIKDTSTVAVLLLLLLPPTDNIVRWQLVAFSVRAPKRRGYLGPANGFTTHAHTQTHTHAVVAGD